MCNKIILEGSNLLVKFYNEYNRKEILDIDLITALMILDDKLSLNDNDKNFSAAHDSILIKSEIGEFVQCIWKNDIDKSILIMENLLQEKKLSKDFIDNSYITHYLCHSARFRNLYRIF